MCAKLEIIAWNHSGSRKIEWNYLKNVNFAAKNRWVLHEFCAESAGIQADMDILIGEAANMSGPFSKAHSRHRVSILICADSIFDYFASPNVRANRAFIAAHDFWSASAL